MDCINSKIEQNKLRLVYGDVTLGVQGDDFSYLFSYACGGMESMVIEGKEWLYRAPKPAFWRALTDNDRGNKFHLRSGMWLAADMFINCIRVAVCVDGEKIKLPIAPANNQYTGKEAAECVEITFYYETITVPATTVDVTYKVEMGGKVEVKVQYHGNDALPQLPVFGMKFIMPTKAVSYRYNGLSGETYPDRMAGGVRGVYEIEGLPITPYLVPQDCQVHMDSGWLEVYRNSTLNNVDCKRKVKEPGNTQELENGEKSEIFGLRFSAVKNNFAFSCLPYTAEELENATHQEELPPARRTVVSILGAVRGVGGINSWGADVENAYHIDAGKDISFSFLIEKAVREK